MAKINFPVQALALILLLLCSCNTLKRSQTRLFKIERDHPELLMEYCAEEFPIKTDTFTSIRLIKGDSLIINDTLYVDCDTVIRVEDRIVRIPVTKIIYKPDTVIQEKLVVQENTAAVQLERKAHEVTKSELTAQTKSTKNWRIAFMIACGVVVVMAVVMYLTRPKRSIV